MLEHLFLLESKSIRRETMGQASEKVVLELGFGGGGV